MQSKTAKFIRSILFLVGVRVRIGFLQPDNQRFGFAAKGSSGFFVDGLDSIFGSPVFGPFDDSSLFECVFVVELLEHNGKVLGFFNGEKLQGANQMALDDLVAVNNLGNDRSVFLDLLVLEKLGCDGGTDKDLDLVVGLERGRHLLVGDHLGNITGRSIRILGKILAGALDGKFHCTFVVDTSLGSNLVVLRVDSKVAVFFLAEHRLLEVVFFFVAGVFG
mmetsp:Transcript_22702/g.53631  ORF Transcript_22702/g.53631 Transcript_22702/m.53631 type:complete len:220 (+) Transcript_22702:210-869(+)